MAGNSKVDSGGDGSCGLIRDCVGVVVVLVFGLVLFLLSSMSGLFGIESSGKGNILDIRVEFFSVLYR